MTTSGSFDFSVTASQVIQSSYEDLGVIVPGGTPSSAQIAMALNRLNVAVKQLQYPSSGWPGISVLSRQRVTLFLAKGQQTYTIGPAATDSRATTQYGRTSISATEAAGQTVLSITSNTDVLTYPGTTVTMTNGDNIGIQLDDGTIQWTTISGTPGATATVVAALTSQATAGNYVYWFTTRAQRLPYVEFCDLRNFQLIDVPLRIYREVADYERLPNKQAQGDPWAVLVEPLRLNTRITLPSQPLDVTKQLRITGMYPAEDYDATTDDIAFPQEAFGFLSWELAFRLSTSAGRWTAEMQANYANAKMLYSGVNPENSSAYFQPGRD